MKSQLSQDQLAVKEAGRVVTRDSNTGIAACDKIEPMRAGDTRDPQAPLPSLAHPADIMWLWPTGTAHCAPFAGTTGTRTLDIDQISKINVTGADLTLRVVAIAVLVQMHSLSSEAYMQYQYAS